MAEFVVDRLDETTALAAVVASDIEEESVEDETAEGVRTLANFVIADCEAKRRIVAGTWGRADDLPGVGEGMSRAFDFAAKMLAQPYADHPDFRDEWRL